MAGNGSEETMNTETTQAAVPVQRLVNCLLVCPVRGGDYEVCWAKEIALPFYPRREDRISIDFASSLTVSGSHYSVDEQRAEVHMRAWPLGDKTWEANKKEMESYGWEWWDTGGDVPPGFDN